MTFTAKFKLSLHYIRQDAPEYARLLLIDERDFLLTAGLKFAQFYPTIVSLVKQRQFGSPGYKPILCRCLSILTRSVFEAIGCLH